MYKVFGVKGACCKMCLVKSCLTRLPKRYHFSCGLDRKDARWLSFTPSQVVFGSIWNVVLFQDDGISPVCKIWFMMPRRAVATLSGAKCNDSATNPLSSEALFIFSRLMAPFNSCKLQFGSVKCNGRVGLPGCP